ncbi:hypothetical protein STEG23_018700 [Scotinomys teguina]
MSGGSECIYGHYKLPGHHKGLKKKSNPLELKLQADALSIGESGIFKSLTNNRIVMSSELTGPLIRMMYSSLTFLSNFSLNFILSNIGWAMSLFSLKYYFLNV